MFSFPFYYSSHLHESGKYYYFRKTQIERYLSPEAYHFIPTPLIFTFNVKPPVFAHFAKDKTPEITKALCENVWTIIYNSKK